MNVPIGFKPKRRHWTQSQLQALRTLYPKWPKSEIMKAFPGRSWHAIITMAHHLGLKRTAVRIYTASQTRLKGRMPQKEWARELRSARIAKGETIRSLSKRLGWTEKRINIWELGHENPRLQALEDWCSALGYRLTVERIPSEGLRNEGNQAAA